MRYMRYLITNHLGRVRYRVQHRYLKVYIDIRASKQQKVVSMVMGDTNQEAIQRLGVDCSSRDKPPFALYAPYALYATHAAYAVYAPCAHYRMRPMRPMQAPHPAQSSHSHYSYVSLSLS